MPLFAWLLAAVAPLAKRILAALGIGWVTFEALGLLVDQVKDAIIAQWGAMSGDMLAIVTMSGMGTALGIILGAFVARVSFQSLARLGRIVS